MYLLISIMGEVVVGRGVGVGVGVINILIKFLWGSNELISKMSLKWSLAHS